MSLFCGKYKPCRILPVSHGKRALLNGNLPVRYRGADLQHVSLQDPLASLYKVVGVILKEGGSLRILRVRGHDLHQAHHGRRLPVSLSAKAVALFHQALDRQPRKLL